MARAKLRSRVILDRQDKKSILFKLRIGAFQKRISKRIEFETKTQF